MNQQELLNQGLDYHYRGQYEKAQACYKKIPVHSEYYSETLYLSGMIAHQENNHIQAIKLITQALKINPLKPAYHDTLAVVYTTIKQYKNAQCHLETAIKLDPDFEKSYCHLGNLSMEQGLFSQAVDFYKKSLTLNPHVSITLNNLGCAFIKLKQPQQALKYCLKALQLNNTNSVTYLHLGRIYQIINDFEQAIHYFKMAQICDPNNVLALNNLANCYRKVGETDLGVKLLRQAIQLKHESQIAQSNYLFHLHSIDNISPETLFTAHIDWAQKIESSIKANTHSNQPDPNRRIKIGYLAPDFRCHSLSFFVQTLLEHFNQQEFEIFIYANQTEQDEYTERFQTLADHWYNIFALSDQAVVELIMKEPIDILFDPGIGHAANNRLPVFVHKPAPIQITQYPGSTGLSRMDYRLSDPAFNSLPDYSSETLIQLPILSCYTPPRDAPPVNKLPCSEQKLFTFGSLSNLPKISSTTIDLWATILKKMPNSQLILKSIGFQASFCKERLIQEFEQHDIERHRLKLLPYSRTIKEHLSIYNQIDLVLDTYPYNGHITTCEALWMGVPVVTLIGDTPFSRLSSSILQSCDLTELIAQSPHDYIETVMELASKQSILQDYRTNLRHKLSESKLCDSINFIRELEVVYRQLWQQWCQKLQR